MHRSILRRMLLVVVSVGWWGSVGITDSQGQTCRNNYVCTAFPNTVSADLATVGGGGSNLASGYAATIGGGDRNAATETDATVAGGFDNTANKITATVGGGYINTASGDGSTVGGGYTNTASGDRSTVSGGLANAALGFAAAIPGGYNNRAGGNFSFAAGRQAKARHKGAFVWADATAADFASTTLNQFNVRASGGTRIFSNAAATVGVRLAPGSNAWSIASDRTLKEDFHDIDKQRVLANVQHLKIQNWKLKDEAGNVRHVGPVAQEFHAAFHLGGDERYLHSGDVDGIALVAIQALAERVDTLQQQNAELQQQNTLLQTQMSRVLRQVQTLVQERESGRRRDVALAE